jgi:hypothetical protein
MVRHARIVLAGFLFSHLVTANVARAEPIALPVVSPFLQVATEGEVTIHFAGTHASFDSLLFLAGSDEEGPFFPNHSTSVGQSARLGRFNAGTELVFRLHVLNTEEDFLTGPARRNADGLVHAIASLWSGSSAIRESGVHLGFEDLRGGGDRDFNDFQFVVTNATLTDTAPAPEPASLLLVATGAVALRRRLRNRGRPGSGARP